MATHGNSRDHVDTAELTASTIPRAASGIEGLDGILEGGFPRHGCYLIQGSSGTGKTTLGLQFLREGAKQGENVLYFALSENKDELNAVARSHRWSLDGIHVYELSIADQLKTQAQQTVFYPSEVELAEITQALLNAAKPIRPTRAVFDSLSDLHLLAGTPLHYRRQVLTLKEYFAEANCTVLFVDNHSSMHSEFLLESLVHGVVEMEQLPVDYGADCRRLRIKKMRGMRFSMGYHDYAIRTGGLIVYPRPIIAEHAREPSPQRVSSGLDAFDSLLGGGLDGGSSSLLIGPSGVGKSTIALRFAVSAADRGEPVAIFNFEESLSLLMARCEGLGMDCKGHIESGLITFQQIDASELSPGEFFHNVRYAVQQRGVRMIIIDSVNGYLNVIRQERSLTLFLNELLRYLAYQRVTMLGVVCQHGGGFVPTLPSDFNISYLADIILLFRYYEIKGEIRQAISVFKRRGGAHERAFHELCLEGMQGIRIGQALRDLRGVLSGLAIYEGADRNATP